MNKAIIIQGPQGSGKSLLAKLMARMAGLPYSVVTIEEVNSNPQALARLLIQGPKTVIFEGVLLEEVPGLVSYLEKVHTTTMTLSIGAGDKIIRIPNLIFCVGGEYKLVGPGVNKVFEVIKLSGGEL